MLSVTVLAPSTLYSVEEAYHSIIRVERERERCIAPTLWWGRRRRSFGVCGRRSCKGGKLRDEEARISSQLRSQAHLVRLFLCWSLCSSGGSEALLVGRSIVAASNGSTAYNASYSAYSSSFSPKSKPHRIESLLLWFRPTYVCLLRNFAPDFS